MEGNSQGKRRLTIREAATLLDVHPNTVRTRIKDGSIEAEKVVTERGPTWMIDPDSLTTNAPPSGSQQLVGRVPQEALTALAREIVREAGLQRDSEQDAWVEGEKLTHETAKTQALIIAGLLGASGAAWFIPAPKHAWLLVLAFVLGLASLASTMTLMYFIAAEVRMPRLPPPVWVGTVTEALSTLGFTVATALLGLYIILNV